MAAIISDTALIRAFAHLGGLPSAALAVSGGPDSMALMALACRWAALLQRGSQTLIAVTVDHGLRPESKDEAAFVAKWASNLGIVHATLTWTGDKPKTGLQAAARTKRYELLTDHCRIHAIASVVTAHTEDDQAETLLMRLRRGSGLDGLAAMAAISEMNGIPLIRPLLGFSKARLAAYVRANAIPFLRDPSNDNSSFERVRLRSFMHANARAGLTRSALALSARRLGRSRDALSRITEDFLDANFEVSPLGDGEFSWQAFSSQPEELALRALSRAVQLVAGKRETLRLAKVEALLEKLMAGKQEATLGGCLIAHSGDRLCFYREPGRINAGVHALRPDTAIIWDGRFQLTLSDEAPAAARVKTLGAEGWLVYRRAMKEGYAPAIANRLAALTTPALWHDRDLLCAPILGFVNTKLIPFSTPPLSATMVPALARFHNPGLAV